MNKYPQDPSVPKDIKSVFQLLEVIEDSREKRRERSSSKSVREDKKSTGFPGRSNEGEPVLAYVVGYEGGETVSGALGVQAPEDPTSDDRYESSFHLEYWDWDLASWRQGKTVESLAALGDETKSMSVFNRVDVGMVFPELLRQAESMLASDPKKWGMYEVLYRECYPNYNYGKTAAIGYDPDLKQFTLFINKTFIVYMTVMNLMNGYPKSTMSMLKEVFGDPEVDTTFAPLNIAGFTCFFTIAHEMGHILYKHLGKRAGLYDDHDHDDVNKYGDVLINLNLTSLVGGEPDKLMVPNVGLGKDEYLRGKVDDAQAAFLEFYSVLSDKFVLKSSVRDTWEATIKAKPADIFMVFKPEGYVSVGLTTSHLINFYKRAQKVFKLDPPPKIEIASGPKEEPVTINSPVAPGQIVTMDDNGDVAVVMDAGPVTEKDGQRYQEVVVVRKDKLPEDVQQQVNQAIEEAGKPSFGQALPVASSSGSMGESFEEDMGERDI